MPLEEPPRTESPEGNRPEPRVLLDECIPRGLRYAFPDGFTVHTVAYAGFAGLKNGRLLSAAQGRYDVIVTIDQGFASEQNLRRHDLALITIAVGSDSELILRNYVSLIVEGARKIGAGESYVIVDGGALDRFP